MIIPGWRRSGFNPCPSFGVKMVALAAGLNMLGSTFPLTSQKRVKGFSKTTIMPRKNVSVMEETTITHGRNSASRSHLRNVTAELKTPSNQDQKTSDT